MKLPSVPRCGRIGVLLCIATLAVVQGAAAADRVNVMTTWRAGSIEPWQVRPGAMIDLFGNAGTGGGIADGTAIGETYTWACVADNPGNVQIVDDGLLIGTVTDDRYIFEAVTFNLLGGSTRELVTCTLTVDDLAGGVDADTVVIDIVDPTDMISDTPLENQAIEVNIAIQDGLRYAYLNQQANGRWAHGSQAGWDCGTTGFTVWAFANSGHLPTNDVDTDIYAEFVQQGIDFILSKASAPGFGPQPNIGDPDGDANGRIINLCPGLFSPDIREGYSTPIAAAGILAAYSAAPGTVVAPGSFAGQMPGDTYVNLIQDTIDWIAYAQEEGGGRGGWRYGANYGSADTSVDSWHYVAMEGFETVFGGAVLELVKQEAERRIDSSQSQGGPGDLGQFGYGGTAPIAFDGNATTAGGISGLVMVTAGGRVAPLLDGGTLSSATFPDTATRKSAAVAHLGLRWDAAPGVWAGNPGNFYAMWTTARALRLNATGLLVDKNGVVFDWETGEDQANPGVLPPAGDVHEGYFGYLERTQAGDGSWAPTVNIGNWTRNLNTAWGILILQPTVFGPPDVTPPDCFLSDFDPGPPMAIEVTTQDGGTGLNAIVVTVLENATVVIPPFTPGTNDIVLVTAEKINQSLPAHLELSVTDIAGNETVCDPVMVRLRIPRGQRRVSETFHGIPEYESFISLQNSSPGVRRFQAVVNGKGRYGLRLQPEEEALIDVAESMVPGDNTITLSAWGAPGSWLTVLISDGVGEAGARELAAKLRAVRAADGANLDWGGQR